MDSMKPTGKLETTLELLPTWIECERHRIQMGAQGTSALMNFIYEQQPSDDCSEPTFRERLAALIDEVSGVAVERHYIGSNKK